MPDNKYVQNSFYSFLKTNQRIRTKRLKLFPKNKIWNNNLFGILFILFLSVSIFSTFRHFVDFRYWIAKMGFLSWLTRTSLRVGAVAAAVKISVDNGMPKFWNFNPFLCLDVWSLKTDVTEQKYGELKKNIVPGAIVYKEKVSTSIREISFKQFQLPQNDELETAVGSKWNVSCWELFDNNFWI